MDVALLPTFLAVYRTGSISAAAPLLELSQPAVTARIHTLESQLGRQLFIRQARGVAPTTVAHELARQVAPHVDALAGIARTGISHSVHLAGPAELTTALVIPALAAAVSRGLRLRITFGLSDDLLVGLADARYDVVISTVRPRGRAIVATALADEEFVLVAAPAVAKGIKLGTDPAAALRNVPILSYAEDLPIIRRYWRTVFGSRPSASAAVVVPDLRGVLAGVMAGIGVSVLPRYLCAEQFADGNLVALLTPEQPPINTFFLASRAGTMDLPGIAVVRDALLADAKNWSS